MSIIGYSPSTQSLSFAVLPAAAFTREVEATPEACEDTSTSAGIEEGRSVRSRAVSSTLHCKKHYIYLAMQYA